MIQILINSDPKNIKKMILALLKSKNADRVISQDYVKSYSILDNKIQKTHHKVLCIYTDKTIDIIKGFIDKGFAGLGVEFI